MNEQEEASQPKQLQGDELLPALAEIQAVPHWVCWRLELRKGKDGKEKLTKIPYNPRTYKAAESDNAQTWSDYATALQAYQRSQSWKRPYDGIGFMFAGSPFAGIDFDHCIAPDGTIDDWAKEWIERVNSYLEYSPSREGFHALVRGTIPKGINRKLKGKRHPEAGIEMYSGQNKGRFFTITGKHVPGTPTTIEPRQDVLDALYQKLTAGTEKSQTPPNAIANRGSATPAAAPASLNDEQLLQKAVLASNGNGDRFRALYYHGQTSGYPSASEADLALCMMLAFWTGKDLERMDRLFRRSALYREKWDTARSDSTYGRDTLHQAAALCGKVYNPLRNPSQLERDIDALLKQIAQQQAHLLGNKKRGKPYQLIPKEVTKAKVLEYLEMNEYGDARYFAESFANQVCYDHTNDTWYLWHGHHWKEDKTGKIRQLVAGVLGSLYLRVSAELNTTYTEVDLKLQALKSQEMTKESSEMEALIKQAKMLAGQMDALQTRARVLRTAKRMRNVLTFIQAEMGMTSDMWDTNPWLLAVPNGVIDLQTGACRDGVPGDYIRTVAPTEWTDLDTPCPRFEQFLQEIFADKPDRDELIAFLHRLLGYCITGLTTLHIFPILYGAEGRNGKDTLLSILKAVLGLLVGAVSNDVFLAQDKQRAAGAASPHLVDLQGKRLVWGSETKEGDRLNVSQIKQLTGGGDISARANYGHQYTFPPTHKLLLMTNYKPHAEARDKAFWSRACLIDFGLRFVEDPKEPNERQADLTLKETLLQECSGILAWLVRGCLEWQKQGLNIPPSVQLATGKYRDEEDRLLLFIRECCIVKPDVYVKAQALFTAYRTWYEENQFGGKSMNGKLFGDEMGKRFTRKHTKAGRIYQGIGLLSTGPEQGSLFEEQESGEGSVKGHVFLTDQDKPASEATSQIKDGVIGEGCEGCDHIFSQNEKNKPPIEGIYGNMLHTLHPSSSVTINKTASEAESRPIQEPKNDPSPTLHPSPQEEEVHRCWTSREYYGQRTHRAVATHKDHLGYWWCDRCANYQQKWMEYGSRHDFAAVAFSDLGFEVPAGQNFWLMAAQDAGYELLEKALVLLQQREEQGQ